VALVLNTRFYTYLLPKIFGDTEVDFVSSRKTVKSSTSEFNNTNGVAHHPYRYVLFTLTQELINNMKELRIINRMNINYNPGKVGDLQKSIIGSIFRRLR